MSDSQSYDTPTAAPTTTKPWSDFFDISSLSLPVSLSDATTRLNHNLSNYQLNYINIALIILFLTLALRPLSLLIIFVVSLSWYYLFFFPRSTPLELFGFFIDDRILLTVLSVLTFVAFFVAHAWMNLLVSAAISAVIVVLHGVLRVPSFGDQDPYGGLLDAEAGGYSQF